MSKTTRRRRRKEAPKDIEDNISKDISTDIDQSNIPKQTNDQSDMQIAQACEAKTCDTQSDLNIEPPEGWDSLPRKGYFGGGRKSPGRPAINRSVCSDLAPPSEIDLLQAMNEALTEMGPKQFCKRVIKASPITAVSLIQSLTKAQADKPTDHVVNLTVSPAMAGVMSNMTGGDTIDVDQENEPYTQPQDVTDTTTTEPEQEPTWECPACHRIHPISLAACSCCGTRRDGAYPKEREHAQTTSAFVVGVNGIETPGQGAGWKEISTLGDVL